MTKVVARVEGRDITEEEVLAFIEEIGPQVAMQFQSADGIKTIIQEMINQEMLYLDAKENNFDQEEDFVKVIKRTEESLLKNYAFTKVIGGVSVSDEDAEAFFKDHKKDFAKEAVEASHILVDTEEGANKIKEELSKGKSFEEAAKEYSSCPSKENGGNLGEFSRGTMVPEFEEVAFGLEEGEVSEPVKTQFGYHLIRVNKKKDPESLTFKDVYKEVKTEATRVKQQEAYLEKLESLKSKYKFEILDTNI